MMSTGIGRWLIYGLTILIVAIACVISAESVSAQTPAITEDQVEQAAIIFTGKVVKVHAANLAAIPPSDSTVVVKIDDVLHSPPSLGDLTGREVTIKLVKPGSAKSGERLLFFTNGWVFGANIALEEVSHQAATAEQSTFRVLMPSLLAEQQTRPLEKRIEDAPLVITGKVLETHPVSKQSFPISEHDPDWWQATIEVSSVEKGSPPGNKVTVQFANSTDVLWERSPKFHPGQEGIWILHHTNLADIPVEIFTALNADDFQSVEKLLRVKSTIQLQSVR